MSINDFKMPSLKEKLAQREQVKQELDKIDDVIDKITSPKKVKIIKKK